VVEKLAAIRGETADRIATATTANLKRILKL
jgi:Tat protein secretion system quality control protein TatD with DNase activity